MSLGQEAGQFGEFLGGVTAFLGLVGTIFRKRVKRIWRIYKAVVVFFDGREEMPGLMDAIATGPVQLQEVKAEVKAMRGDMQLVVTNTDKILRGLGVATGAAVRAEQASATTLAEVTADGNGNGTTGIADAMARVEKELGTFDPDRPKRT